MIIIGEYYNWDFDGYVRSKYEGSYHNNDYYVYVDYDDMEKFLTECFEDYKKKVVNDTQREIRKALGIE